MNSKTLLDYAIQHSETLPEHVWLYQPHDGGQLTTYTWQEVIRQARLMASHLRSLPIENRARIGILSKNCAHVLIAELAIWLAGGCTVSIFPTETAKTIRYVLEHSDAQVLFVGKLDSWAEQRSGVPETIKRIYLPLAAPETQSRASDEQWNAIIERMRNVSGLGDLAKPTANDLAMIVYTSGSTGQPKGVMHNFAGVTAAAEGITQTVKAGMKPGAPVRLLSYLPMAHVVERAWVAAAGMVRGDSTIYFSESLDSFLTDLRRAKPTVFLSVPRLWLKFQQGVQAKMPPAKLKFLLALPWIGKKVGKKVLTGLGLDHVQMAGSGSAPISAELILWYRSLGLNLLEGYGMSEDFAYSNSSAMGVQAPNYVGSALPGVKVKISSEGEILIKSPATFVGYFKQDELYAECFDADGYFCTGDLGELRTDGLLKITGRKKELFKTGKGKYVAPAPIENQLNNCPLLEASMVSGPGQQAPYALVVLAEHIRAAGLDDAKRAEITSELKRLLHEINEGLPDYEQLRMLVVAKAPFSIENGCLTPTLKIKRNRIETLVEPELERWYNEPSKVIWQA